MLPRESWPGVAVSKRSHWTLRAVSDQIAQVRSGGRIGADELLEVGRGEAGANREPEEVDQLARLGPQQMGAQDARRAFLEEHLGRGVVLADPFDTVPVAHVVGLYLDLEPLLARTLFVEADPGKLRDREHRARHAGVVGRLAIALEKVDRDHRALEAGDRREQCSRRGGRVPGRIDAWVGEALQKLVDRDALLVRAHVASLEIETLQ